MEMNPRHFVILTIMVYPVFRPLQNPLQREKTKNDNIQYTVVFFPFFANPTLGQRTRVFFVCVLPNQFWCVFPVSPSMQCLGWVHFFPDSSLREVAVLSLA